MPKTDFGEKMHGRGAFIFTVFGYPLRPGESVQDHSDLAKEFAFTKLGKFTVQAERIAAPHDVKSNKVTFTLTQ